MKIEDDNDRLVLIAAFRYALGRMTYMPSVICKVLQDNWKDLTESDRKLIQREIQEAIDRNLAGMSCDVNNWKEILNLTT